MQRSATPAQRIAAECARVGSGKFVDGCIAILNGTKLDSEMIRVLGGLSADSVFEGREGGIEGYWPRVWAARGLLHCYERRANGVLRTSLEDESWRVREMALKVIAGHGVTELFDDVLVLGSDKNPRVRRAAERSVRLLNAQMM